MAGPYDFIIIVGVALLSFPGLKWLKSKVELELQDHTRKRMISAHETRLLAQQLEAEALIKPLEIDLESRARRAQIDFKRMAIEHQIVLSEQKFAQLALAAPSAEPNAKQEPIPEGLTIPGFEEVLGTTGGNVNVSSLKNGSIKAYYESYIVGIGKTWADYEGWCKRKLMQRNLLSADTVSAYMSEVSGDIVQVQEFPDVSGMTKRNKR